MSRRNNNFKKDGKTFKPIKREQPRKNSKTTRINLDNERVSRLMEDYAKETHNDPEWYALNPELMKSAGSISFSETTGQPVQIAPSGSIYVPGVMRLELEPSLANGQDFTQLNAAAKQIYSFVVHANSRNTKYNANDMMLTIVAGMQVFAAISAGIRAYGTIRSYSQVNKYKPAGLITAMGFDFSDLLSNLNKMWFDLNQLIAESTQIWIPNTMNLLTRWMWVNSNIYMDAESIKGQYYIMGFHRFMGFSETGFSTGTALGWMTTNGTVDVNGGSTGKPIFSLDAGSNVKWDTFITVVRGMINALVDSEDRGIMMGDILKAYGSDKIFAFKEIPADYTLIPVYDREVLSQIENTTTVRTNSVLAYKQDQSTGNITSAVGNGTGTVIKSTEMPAGYQILNFHGTDTPTPAQVMVATRLCALGFIATGEQANPNLSAITCGTEICTGIHVVEYATPTGLKVNQYINNPFTSFTYASLVDSLRYLTAFDWAPWMYVKKNGTNYTIGTTPMSGYVTPIIENVFGDFDYYTVVTVEQLNKINNTALYSLFDVPVF